MKNKTFYLVALIIALFGSLSQAEVVPIEGISYNTQSDMHTNLSGLVGKRIHLIMVGGNEVSGIVKDVGIQNIHLEKLSGKDFFDALVRIKDISLIEVAFRQIKRNETKRKPPSE